MKRKTTITLTIVGLLGVAGMLYAANHVFFSPVQDPTFHVGPIGVAAAPTDLIASEYCGSNTLFTNIDRIDCNGSFAPIAMIPTPNGGGCFELYVAIASSQSANAGFTPRDLFITAGPHIYQLRPPNPPTLFATIPDGGCSSTGGHTGITFDRESTFGNNMLVTCKGSGGVWMVDGAGTVTNIGFITSNGRPGHLENPTVVPRAFGPFGGQLWVTDEDYPDTVSTVPGAIHAIDPNGNVALDVVEWRGAEAVLVIPDTLCTFCSNNGTLFQAITLDNFGPVGIYEYFPADFSGLGGNVLVPSEEGVGTALVTFNGTNYVTSFFDNIPSGIFEGASFADCDVPTPTPTFTPTPTATATATFTPTPTATATATATFTPTPTPTPPACAAAAALAASGAATGGTTVTSSSFTLKANTTYLVFAFTHSSAGDSATSFSFSGGSPTFNNIGPGSASYNGTVPANNIDYEFGRWLNGGASDSTGTITVTFVHTTSQAYVQVIELCGNDTSNPIVQNAYTTSPTNMTSSPFTANLTAPPTGTNFAVYFLNANENLTNTVTSSPAITRLVYANAGSGTAGTWFNNTPGQNQQFCQGGSCPGPIQHWGTIAVEIKRP